MHYMTYVVVEVGVANSDPITSMSDVQEAVIINLRGSQASWQISIHQSRHCWLRRGPRRYPRSLYSIIS